MAEFDQHAARYTEKLDSAISSSGYSADTVLLPKMTACREIWEPRLSSAPIRFLDYGCGPGRLASVFATVFGPGARYFGIDVSEASLEQARIRYGETCRFGSRENPPFAPDQRFDIIIAAGVFHHIVPSERLDVLRWLHTLLDGEGSLLIWEHNPWNPVTRRIVRLCEFDGDARLISAPALTRLVRAAGFSWTSISYRTFFPFRWRRFDDFLKWCPMGGQYSLEARR